MQQIGNKTNKSSKREGVKGTSSSWEQGMNTQEEINTRASTCLIRSLQAGCSSGSPLTTLVGIWERCPLFLDQQEGHKQRRLQRHSHPQLVRACMRTDGHAERISRNIWVEKGSCGDEADLNKPGTV